MSQMCDKFLRSKSVTNSCEFFTRCEEFARIHHTCDKIRNGKNTVQQRYYAVELLIHHSRGFEARIDRSDRISVETGDHGADNQKRTV